MDELPCFYYEVSEAIFGLSAFAFSTSSSQEIPNHFEIRFAPFLSLIRLTMLPVLGIDVEKASGSAPK